MFCYVACKFLLVGLPLSAMAEKKDRFMRPADVCDELGVVYSTLWRWVKAGRFPQPFRLGSRLAWPRVEFEQWLESRRAA